LFCIIWGTIERVFIQLVRMKFLTESWENNIDFSNADADQFNYF